jgi:hypothetical protein
MLFVLLLHCSSKQGANARTSGIYILHTDTVDFVLNFQHVHSSSHCTMPQLFLNCIVSLANASWEFQLRSSLDSTNTTAVPAGTSSLATCHVYAGPQVVHSAARAGSSSEAFW